MIKTKSDQATRIQAYQQKCFQTYKAEIEYPPHYSYFFGQPIFPLIPIETEIHGYMIVGAYPSAKFFALRSSSGELIMDVPIADNDSPFSNELYFDGTRVRTIPSGKELNEVILANIGVSRSDCWITDLVKVFLFKPGHVNRYHSLGRTDIEPNRDCFETYAKKSLDFLKEEVSLATPKAIFLLGVEVTQAVFNMNAERAKSKINGEPTLMDFYGIQYPVFCLPHPGILMKDYKANPWPKRFAQEIAPKIRVALQKL